VARGCGTRPAQTWTPAGTRQHPRHQTHRQVGGAAGAAGTEQTSSRAADESGDKRRSAPQQKEKDQRMTFGGFCPCLSLFLPLVLRCVPWPEAEYSRR
jgi:hypothetical protein